MLKDPKCVWFVHDGFNTVLDKCQYRHLNEQAGYLQLQAEMFALSRHVTFHFTTLSHTKI